LGTESWRSQPGKTEFHPDRRGGGELYRYFTAKPSENIKVAFAGVEVMPRMFNVILHRRREVLKGVHRFRIMTISCFATRRHFSWSGFGFRGRDPASVVEIRGLFPWSSSALRGGDPGFVVEIQKLFPWSRSLKAPRPPFLRLLGALRAIKASHKEASDP
jgi:hypothetical protein